MEKDNICVVFHEKKGCFYFLHRVDTCRKSYYYYFSKEKEGAIPLPEGYEVVINEKTKTPFLRRKKKWYLEL